MSRTVKRILIKGSAETDVHGVGLREAIHQIGMKKGIPGRVRNFKGEPVVEVLVPVDNADVFVDALRKELSHHPNSLLFKDVEIDGPEEFLISEHEEFRKEFELIRSDELTEMVWALQGAGKMFMKAEEMREERRKEAMLKGLSLELAEISKICDEIQGGKPSQFNLPSIEGILKEPPRMTDTSLTSQRNLYQKCQEANRDINRNGINEALKKEIVAIRSLVESVVNDFPKH